MSEAGPSAATVLSKCLRRLKWNELVTSGDFVEDGNQGFEPWEGPRGFRADSFVKTIYRKRKHQLGEPGKLSL